MKLRSTVLALSLLVAGCAQSLKGLNTAPRINAMSDCGVSGELQTDIKEINGVRQTDDATLIRVKKENVPQTRRGFLRFNGCWIAEKTDQPNATPKKTWQAGASTVEVYWLEPVKEPVRTPSAAGPAEQGDLYKLLALPYEQWWRY